MSLDRRFGACPLEVGLADTYTATRERGLLDAAPRSSGFLSSLVHGAACLGQTPYVERLIGSIRRERLDHVVSSRSLTER